MRGAIKLLSIVALAGVSAPVMGQDWATIDAEAAKEWSKGNHARAIAMWVHSADQYGSVQAMYNLGQAYRLGMGVPKDARISTEYFKRAADAGFVRAEEQVGLIYYSDLATRDLAFLYLQKAAEKGAPRANYVLGVASLRGEGLAQDNQKAVAFLERASGIKQAEGPLREARKKLEMAAIQHSENAGSGSGTRSRVGAGGAGRNILPAQASPALSAEVARVEAARKAPLRDRNGDPIAGKQIVNVVHNVAKPALSGNTWGVVLGEFDTMAIANVKWLRISHRHSLLDFAPTIISSNDKHRLSFGNFGTEGDAQRICNELKRKKTSCSALMIN